MRSGSGRRGGRASRPTREAGSPEESIAGMGATATVRHATLTRRAWLRVAGGVGITAMLGGVLGCDRPSADHARSAAASGAPPSGAEPLGQGSASNGAPNATAATADIAVYADPSCGCCRNWIAHVEQNGFHPTVHLVDDVTPYKDRYGVPVALRSCHTAVVDGYVVEGHVPADLIQRMRAERLAVAGLAVPGMPMGAPGMEGPTKDPYQVIAFTSDGTTSVFASR
ncbi:MAG TPA: DUF411 domain-containing protein [Gemmatimonadaceae bacterium]|nr:DUF411 domain-containing protein [Gemmatimonadaceae bacterium]